jgi:adenylate cyclase
MSPIRTEAELRAVLTGEDPGFARASRWLRRVPSPPRCKLCSAPFAGPGGAVLRHFGYGRFAGNAALCENCITSYSNRNVSGTEIPLTLLFADIRGSTSIGERLRPSDFRAFLEHFYLIGSDVVLHHDGLVDKLVGDGVVALFFGGVSGPGHASKAIAAGRDLLTRAGAAGATPMGSIPVGAAVHTGEAYVGIVGSADSATIDFTALGDAVNTTARLASAAAAGELLVSLDAARAAAIATSGLDARLVEVRGRSEPVEVVVEAVSAPA